MKRCFVFQYPIIPQEFIVARDVITEDGRIFQEMLYPPTNVAIIIAVGGIK